MAKNPRRMQEAAANQKSPALAAAPIISKRGKKIIFSGVGMAILGYVVLTYTDPAGQNWASTLSPALLVMGYALIGVGIVFPDPTPEIK